VASASLVLLKNGTGYSDAVTGSEIPSCKTYYKYFCTQFGCPESFKVSFVISCIGAPFNRYAWKGLVLNTIDIQAVAGYNNLS